MKLTSLIFAAAILLCTISSCANRVETNTPTTENFGLLVSGNTSMQGTKAQFARPVKNQQNGGPVKMATIKDPQSGMIICKIPIPNNWTENGDSWGAPGNTKIQEFQGQTLQNGMSADDFIKTQLIPQMQAAGNRIVNVERYSFIEEFEKNYRSKIWTPEPTQNIVTVKGIEFEDNNGIKGIIILHHIASQSRSGTTTQIYAQGMEGDRNFYQENKQGLLYAVSHIQYNPQFIEALNRMQKQQLASNR